MAQEEPDAEHVAQRANGAIGAARERAMAEGRRQTATVADVTKVATDVWIIALMSPWPARKRTTKLRGK